MDQETIEEAPTDIVNRKKMELRAWNVKDMPRQSVELNFGELKSVKEDTAAAGELCLTKQKTDELITVKEN